MRTIHIADLILREDGASNALGLLCTEERVIRALHHVVFGSQKPSYWEGEDCFERPLALLLEANESGFESYYNAIYKVVKEFAPELGEPKLVLE